MKQRAQTVIIVPKRGVANFIAEVEVVPAPHNFAYRGKNWKFLYGKGLLPRVLWVSNYHWCETLEEAVAILEKRLVVEKTIAKREYEKKERNYNDLLAFKQQN